MSGNIWIWLALVSLACHGAFIVHKHNKLVKACEQILELVKRGGL